jgi:predicted MFS family arabinose efflux permease
MKPKNNTKLINKDFVIAFIIQVLIVTCLTLMTTVVPLWMSSKFNSDTADIGFVVGLSGISTIIARPFMGFLLDRWGRKKILYISTFIFGIINFLYIFSTSSTMVLLIRFIQLVPFAASTTAIVTIATDIIPEDKRGEGLSYFTTSTTLPLAIGPSLGYALYKIEWMMPFILSGCVGILCFVASFFLKVPKHEVSTEQYSFKSLFEKKVLIIALISALAYMALPGIFSFVTLYGQKLNINLDHIGNVYTSYAATLLLSRLIGAKIIDKKDPKISGVIALLLLAFGLILIGFSRHLFGLCAGAALLGAGAGIILPTLLMMAINIAPTKKGICNSMVYGGLDVSNSLGASLFGYLTKLFNDFSVSYLVFSGIEWLALGLFLFATLPQYRQHLQISKEQ